MTIEHGINRERQLRAAVLEHIREEKSRTRTWRIVAPVALTSLLLGAGVTYAAATAGGLIGDDSQLATDHPSIEELEAKGIRDAFLRDLETLVGTEDTTIIDVDGKPNGFTSVIVENGTTSVSLYWKGPLPPSVEEVIATHDDVDVRTHAAPYSLLELTQARDVLLGELDGDLDGAGTLILAGADSHGKGLTVRVQSSTLTEDDVRSVVAKLTPVPIVDLEVGEDVGVVLF